jgi:hypothetical protein
VPVIFDHPHEWNLHIMLAPMLLLSVLMACTFIPHEFGLIILLLSLGQLVSSSSLVRCLSVQVYYRHFRCRIFAESCTPHRSFWRLPCMGLPMRVGAWMTFLLCGLGYTITVGLPLGGPLFENSLVVICCTLEGVLPTMSACFQLKGLTHCLLARQE